MSWSNLVNLSKKAKMYPRLPHLCYGSAQLGSSSTRLDAFAAARLDSKPQVSWLGSARFHKILLEPIPTLRRKLSLSKISISELSWAHAISFLFGLICVFGQAYFDNETRAVISNYCRSLAPIVVGWYKYFFLNVFLSAAKPRPWNCQSCCCCWDDIQFWFFSR